MSHASALIAAGWRCCAAGRPASSWRCAAGRAAGQRGGEAGWQPGCLCCAASWRECAAGGGICRCASLLALPIPMCTSHADLKPSSAGTLCSCHVIMLTQRLVPCCSCTRAAGGLTGAAGRAGGRRCRSRRHWRGWTAGQPDGWRAGRSESCRGQRRCGQDTPGWGRRRRPGAASCAGC